MSDPYIGEVRTFAFTYAPTGWAACDGSLHPIAQQQALFSLLGTTYGGDGVSSFALPKIAGLAASDAEIGYYIATEGAYPPRP
jgi:microcystin-dependent protein